MAKSQEQAIAVGVAYGISFGMIIGVLLDDIGLWLSLGLCFGSALGASGAFSKGKPDSDKEPGDERSDSTPVNDDAE